MEPDTLLDRQSDHPVPTKAWVSTWSGDAGAMFNSLKVEVFWRVEIQSYLFLEHGFSPDHWISDCC